MDCISIDIDLSSTSTRSGYDVCKDKTIKRKPAYTTSKNLYHRLLSHDELSGSTLNNKNDLVGCDIVLWRKPVLTLKYFFREMCYLFNQNYLKYHFRRRLKIIAFTVMTPLFILIPLSFKFEKLHRLITKKVFWYFHWVFLGVLSSIGLGTGLHTFVLYLAPHVAKVTIAAYECQSLDFPEPPYPEKILCPEVSHLNINTITLWSIIKKIQFESFCWGAGTALGELPPYFLARAASMSSKNSSIISDGGSYNSAALDAKNIAMDSLGQSCTDYAKNIVKQFVKKMGFLGILVCASVPNPFFDLAGITCGHFLVPFWNFFGATLIGKAVFKVTIQVLFVITIFNEKLLIQLTHYLKIVPLVGVFFIKILEEFLSEQKERLHKNMYTLESNQRVGIFSSLYEVITLVMILYFITSIINSFAKSYYDRTQVKFKSFKV